MSIITAANTATLLQSLKVAQPGDTILLAPGAYAGVSINNFQSAGQVTIASQDAANPARIWDLNVVSSKGLNFVGLEFQGSPTGSSWPFKVQKSEDIHFQGVSVHGSMNGTATDDQNGLQIGNSRNVSITNSEFQQLANALNLGGNTGIRVEGNHFHDIRVDGINATGTSNVVINANYFTDFRHLAGDHSDAIQFFTANRTISATDITITNNVIAQGTGNVMQGVFMGDETGNLPYINVKIAGNVILGGNWNGIAVGNGANVEVTDNFLAGTTNSNASRIDLKSLEGAVVTGNTAASIGVAGINLIQSGNSKSATLQDAGADTLRVWLQQHPAYMLKLPEQLLDVIEGQAGAAGLGATASAAIGAVEATTAVAAVVEPPAVVTTVGSVASEAIAGDQANDHIFGGAGNDTLTGQAGSNYLRGEDGDDKIYGGSGFDDINGNVGNDTAWGGYGNDWVVGGKDNDILFGEEGDDIVYGNLGDDIVYGNAGADVVRGGQGNDLMFGGDGADWVSGDRGDDTISGEAGADIFHSFADAGRDVITDFNQAEGDRVMLDAGTSYSVSQVGANTVVSMVGGGQVILNSVTLANLHDGWLFTA